MGKATRLGVGAGVTATAAFGLSGVAHAESFQVDRLDDSVTADECTQAANDCSLRRAVARANANANPTTQDQITFASGLTGTISLNAAPAGNAIDITESVRIEGPGADLLSITGNDERQIFQIDLVDEGNIVGISGLTLRDGEADNDNINDDHGLGGAVYSADAALYLTNVHIAGSSASVEGGGVFTAAPSASYILSSAVSGNSSPLAGGVAAYGYLYIDGSTVADNSSPDGALIAWDQTYIGNSTISNPGVPSQVQLYGPEGKRIRNTVVANGSGTDVTAFGVGPVDAEFSLIENPGATVLSGTGLLTAVDPGLGALTANGGTVPTMRPAALGPAVDKGLSPDSVDGRGLPRVFDVPEVANAPGGNGADIGAVELQAGEGPFSVPGPPPQIASKKCKNGRKLKKVKGKKKCVKKKRKKKARKG